MKTSFTLLVEKSSARNLAELALPLISDPRRFFKMRRHWSIGDHAEQ